MASINWWPFLIVVFFIGLAARVYPLTGLAVMLMVISLIARAWTRRVLEHVAYTRRLTYGRGYPGETLAVTLEAENRKFLPVAWLRVIDEIAAAIGPQDERLLRPSNVPEVGLLVSLYSLRWWERDRRTYTLLLRQRGIYRMGPALLEAGDLFGLFETQLENSHFDWITIFPEKIDFEKLDLPTADPYGDRKARRRLYEDPNLMMGVREYSPEDDFRRVHWPATARSGSLQVKVYQPVAARVLVVCLNVMTMPHYWEGSDPKMLEHLVRVAAAICERGLADGYRVGLAANTSLAHADQPFRVPPGRSPEQRSRLLSALAGVTQFVTGTFDRFLMVEAPRFPYGATLVVISGMTTPELSETLLRLRRGRQITLLAFDEHRPRDIPGVQIVHRPFVRGYTRSRYEKTSQKDRRVN